jgi:hypothetical protein
MGVSSKRQASVLLLLELLVVVRHHPSSSFKSWYKYIMMMVEIDSNTILLEPLKSRQDNELI